MHYRELLLSASGGHSPTLFRRWTTNVVLKRLLQGCSGVPSSASRSLMASGFFVSPTGECEESASWGSVDWLRHVADNTCIGRRSAADGYFPMALGELLSAPMPVCEIRVIMSPSLRTQGRTRLVADIPHGT
eukprot:TRINITY_DN43395_c0_g1_i1.p1 TRINITY_DN43395_c0_g1~~TRINITY_DN43395_c0_g1_i1.p1  ORF type:complete len:132 (-),score=4.51 TRINITY_DN43395_c0_g1_i1:77-472(-)